MSILKSEVICKKCGGYEVKVLLDNIKEDISICVCSYCGNSGTLDEFILEID